MIAETIIDLVGNTPVVRFKDDSTTARIWVKQEGYNPSGSIKDRACVSNIRAAISEGQLRPGMTILDASSGNMACALAYYGKIFGFKVRVVCSSKLTKDKADFIRYFGAQLSVYGKFTIEGNHYCRDIILAKAPDLYCFLDQLHNWNNPKASYETLGPEILDDLPGVDAIVGSLGSGGSLSGTARAVKEKKPDTKIIAVEAAKGTVIPGTGSFQDGDYETPFIIDAKQRNLFDKTMYVSLDEARNMTHRLRDQGIFVGFQTGGVVHSAIATAQHFGPNGDIVAISGDTGWKNMEKLMPSDDDPNQET